MSEAFPTGSWSLSGALARRVDQVCDRFEAAWKAAGSANKRPRIEDYLVEVTEPGRSVLLRELIVLDVEQRCRAGETLPPLEEFRIRFPELPPEWLAGAMHLNLIEDARLSGPVTIGQTLSHYCIEAQQGCSGMGVVYKAQDTRLGRSVALKFLPAEYARDPRALDRFQREARTASALNHPHICTIYDIDAYQGQPFFAMEYIQGCNLREFARQRVSLATLTHLGAQVAKALHVAHAAGVVHRDIKPDNIMVRDDGYVKVVDFGLARPVPTSVVQAAAGVADVTPPGTLVGTLRYMSPEQARAEAVSSASDIFALGIILYELATGHHPFEADSPIAVLHAILTHAPVPASQLNPEIPALLEALLQRMLAKDARLRPGAAEVERVLVETAQDSARPPSGSAPAPLQRHTVGRQQERGELRSGYESAAAGRGLVLCVAGEPGIGKTTLVEEFLQDRAAENRTARIARGRCSERLAGAEAYLPFLEALDSLLHSDDGEQVARVLKLVAPTWYVQLAPLMAEDSSYERVRADAKTASQERLKRELSAFLHEVSRLRPVILFIDDVHWADVSTVDLLAYIGSRCAAMRLLLVLTNRPSDLLLSKHPFLPVKLDLQARGICREIMLPFLSPLDIARYLALEFPEHGFLEEFATLIHGRTEGNPLFMVDLLRYMRERGVITQEQGRWMLRKSVADIQQELPESVRSLIQRKIDQLSEGDRRLLVAASVQGQEFEAAVVAKVLTLDAADVEERLEVLERVHAFVRRVAEKEVPDGTLTLRYRFVHVLYQNALYALLGPTRKALLSAAVAQALLDYHGEQTAGVAPAIAILLEGARDFARAADYFLLASQNASRVYAYQEAIALAQRSIANAEKLRDKARHARVLSAAMDLGQLHVALCQYEQATLDYEQAEKAAGAAGDKEAEIQAICGQALVKSWLMRTEEERQLGTRALELARAAQSTVGVATAELVLAHERHVVGDLAAAEQFLDRAVPVFEAKPLPLSALSGMSCRGQIHAFRLEYDDAERALTEVLASARGLGSGSHILTNLFFLGMVLGNRGQISEAMSTLREAGRLAELNAMPVGLSRIPNTLGWLHRELLDMESALRLDGEGARLARQLGMIKMEANSHVNLGHDYVVVGELPRAFEHLQQAEQLSNQGASMRWRFRIRLHAELAGYWIARGDLQAAATHASTSLQLAETTLSRKYLAWAHKLLGDIAVLEERLEDGQREYMAALAVLQRHACPIIEWKILKAAAEAAKRQKNATASDEFRGRALTVIDSLAAAVHDDQLRQKFLGAKAVRELRS